MRVILLGAGSSKVAGYPLASELISSIECEAQSSGEVNLREAWKQWDEYRRSTSGNLHLLLSCISFASRNRSRVSRRRCRHTAEAGGLYFGSSDFLDEFEFPYSDAGISLIDPAEPLIGPPDPSVLAYPSFLTQLGGGEMHRVWSLADAILHRADRVEVWGYSLPDSDSAARTRVHPAESLYEHFEAAAAQFHRVDDDGAHDRTSRPV